MAHGNKKYNFEDLKKKGSKITVNTANIYSLRNALREYAKSIGISLNFFCIEDKVAGDIEIERVK